MPADGRLLEIARQQSWAIACSAAPWEGALCESLQEFFGDDVHLHLVRFARTGPWSLRLLDWVEAPARSGGMAPGRAVDIDDVRRHPGIATMVQQNTAAPIRLSDVVDLRSFRHTEIFHRTHSRPHGTKYACAAPLFSSPETFVLLGGHSTREDFSPDQMSLLARLQTVVASALIMRSALRQLCDAAEQHGEHPDRPQPASPTPLRLPERTAESDYWPSAREQQVLCLLTLGLTSSQIARRLEITERTVRKHLDSVYRKAGLTSRTAAAVWWKRRADG
ncbi:MAG: LuxR C-terminal-related transcriptional regulator [Propioniciclava sp.]|uniref:LuxR C-terminal-related transcriptional regulator n=1 Tax=Propioniciclava sp. TaxID=2038686 RepID=UPI0039E41D2E